MFTEKKDLPRTEKPESRRRKRGVHGRGRLKLLVPELPGYYCRWINDTENKLHEATKNDDFDHVSRDEIGDSVGESEDGNSDLGSRVRVLVGKDENGPIYAYLMKKQLSFHEEDKAIQEEERRGREDTLRRGSDQISPDHMRGTLT